MFWLKVLDSVATSEICRDIPSKNTLLLLICPHINSMKTMPPRPSSCFLSLLSCSIKIKFKKNRKKPKTFAFVTTNTAFLLKVLAFVGWNISQHLVSSFAFCCECKSSGCLPPKNTPGHSPLLLPET